MYDEAEPLFREALEVSREMLGNRHPITLTSINNLGNLLGSKGDFAAAKPLLREALEVKRETLGNRHPSTLSSISNLGLLLKAKGDLAAAEPLLREALEVQRETLGNRHPSTLSSTSNLGELSCCKPRATSPPRSRCTARRWRCGARPSAIGTSTRSTLFTTSACCW